MIHLHWTHDQQPFNSELNKCVYCMHFLHKAPPSPLGPRGPRQPFSTALCVGGSHWAAKSQQNVHTGEKRGVRPWEGRLFHQTLNKKAESCPFPFRWEHVQVCEWVWKRRYWFCIILANKKLASQKSTSASSLVGQRLGIHPPMQGTQVPSLLWEDPTCYRAVSSHMGTTEPAAGEPRWVVACFLVLESFLLAAVHPGQAVLFL